MINREVVVTGLGAVSSIGIGKDEFWKNILIGRSGISEVSLFDTAKFKRHNAGEIKNFDPCDFIPKNTIKFLGRASQFAIVAAKSALEDSALFLTDIQKEKIAVIIGTTMTEANVIDSSGQLFIKDEWDKITKQALMNVFSPSIARSVGYFLKAKGENLLIPNACAAGNFALGYGFDLIRKGEIDFAIVGGADSLSRVAFQGFQRLYAMSPDICSPFDKDRHGMLLGEGAGILILESQEHALKRKAPIYAKVLEYGLSCDAFNMTIPSRIGIKKSMTKAIKSANVSIDNIDYISAHGTGTVQNDKEESGAIKEIFGEKKVAVSSVKSMLGHCMGAASALESIVCCLAVKEDIVPPTINFKTPDPECDIDCVPNQARKLKVNIALNNGFAFGGNNCCVVLSKPCYS